MSNDPLQGIGDIPWYAWPFVVVAFTGLLSVVGLLLIIKGLWWICRRIL
jgi:hypothetical protein